MIVSGAELPQYLRLDLFETGLQNLLANSVFNIAFVDRFCNFRLGLDYEHRCWCAGDKRKQ